MRSIRVAPFGARSRRVKSRRPDFVTLDVVQTCRVGRCAFAGHYRSSYSFFSPLGAIEQDYGHLNVLPTTEPTELSVTISGPSEIQPEAVCTWSASATGGQAPYQFSWYNDGIPVGAGPYYTGGKDPASQSDHFTLRVDATDSGSGEGSATLVVYEDAQAMQCMQ